MKRLKKFLSRIRPVYRPSSLLLKCIVLATLVIGTAVLLFIGDLLPKTDQVTDSKRKEAAALEAENQQYRENMGLQNTVAGIKKIARDVLGLVDPDTIIFDVDPQTMQED